MRFAFIDGEKADYPVRMLCRLARGLVGRVLCLEAAAPFGARA
jgi:hypothetical protein